jgi:hypothetical protein
MTIRLDAGNLTQTRSDLGLAIGTDVLAPNGSAASLTAIPAAQITGTLPAVNGGSITDLNATNLGSGTVPDARFPATLPAASAANLTSIPAGNLTGSVADARLPANLQSFPAPGSDGNVLTAASGAWTSAAAAAGGAWVKISSGSISNSNLVITNVTGNIRICFANTDTGTAGQGNDFYVRSSTDNGSSFESGASAYQMTQVKTDCYSATQSTSSFASSAIIGALSGWAFIDIANPTNSNTRTIISCTSTTASASSNASLANMHQLTYGIRDALEDNDAFQITLQGNATGITCDFLVMKLV